jgi:mannose-6-phosphate isomerase-like protein (cupin superfamily)
MNEFNLNLEAEKLEEKGKHIAARKVIKADNFDITIIVYDGVAEVDLHDCGNDELFYVLKGKVEFEIEDKIVPLKEGTGKGVLVKAGEKHKSRSFGPAWVMLVSKHPHKHRVYNLS